MISKIFLLPPHCTNSKRGNYLQLEEEHYENTNNQDKKFANIINDIPV